MEFVEVLSDSHWIIIIELCPCNSSAKFIARSNESSTITEEELVKKRERISRFWTEEEERNSPIYFRNSSQKSIKQNRIQEFPRISVQISEINTGENRNLPLSCLKTSLNPNRRKSMADSKSFGSNQQTLKTKENFRKSVRIQGFTTSNNRCNPTDS